MCEKYPVEVDFTKYEIKEDQISKKELREKIEKMLDDYPEDTMFDRTYGVICLGVVEKDK